MNPTFDNGAHTPGPWLLTDRSVYALQHAGWRKGEEQFENRFYAAVQPGRNATPEELDANARLIAAAPDLLAALERLCAKLDENIKLRFPAENSPMGQAKAAIAKARGAKSDD